MTDDFLLLCWKYEMSKHPKEKENRLWKALEAAVEAVLLNSANKRNWIWFKAYLLESIIWYDNVLALFVIWVTIWVNFL